MLLPGMYSGNRLKKFVKHEGFYKPVESKGETESKNKAEEEREAEVELIEFEVQVPTLIPVQYSKYIKYKEDDKGNIF